jgi:hypothetical protein
MRTIQLPNGKIAKVDDDLYEGLMDYKWYEVGKGYAATTIWLGEDCMPRQKTIYMHRLITGTEDSKDVDHRNGDRLDNRQSNLRAATRSQNLANQGVRTMNKTGMKGVTKIGNKFKAQITHHKKHYNLGTFDTPLEAANVYTKYYKEVWGDFAKVN